MRQYKKRILKTIKKLNHRTMKDKNNYNKITIYNKKTSKCYILEKIQKQIIHSELGVLLGE